MVLMMTADLCVPLAVCSILCRSYRCAFPPLLSAVCGDDLPGDGGRVPWYHQCGDISFWEPCAADRGTLQLFHALHKEMLQTHWSFFPKRKLLIRRECNY